MEESDVTAVFSLFRQANPNPRGELKAETPYQLLVAVVLSAQATDVSVNRVTPALFQAAPTAEAMVALGVDGIREYIRTIGLFNNKAKNLAALSHILVTDHQGCVPNDREALESLPGVGRKTANVVLNICFGQPTLAVDTHVFRVAKRTGLATARTPEAVEKQLMAKIPPVFQKDAHHWLILHGRYVCTARSPRCDGCLIRDFCQQGKKG